MTEHQNESQRELNLWELFLICMRAIGNALCWLWNLCTNTLRLSLQLWYIVLPVVIIGIACGAYYSRKENRIYRVGTMVHLSGVNRTEVSRVYNALTLTTPETINQKQSLSALLGLTAEQTSKLRKFDAWRVIDYQCDSVPDAIDKHNNHDLADTVTVVMPDYLYLTFQTKRPQEAQLVGHAIVNYLNSDEGLQKEYQANYQLLQRKVDFCRTQIDKLDSLTTTFYFEQAGKGQLRYDRWNSAMIVGDRRIDLLHPDILSLIQQTEFAEKQFVLASAPVVPLGDFVIEPKAVNGPLKCLVWGTIAGYLFGCLCAFAWRRRKEFMQWVRVS